MRIGCMHVQNKTPYISMNMCVAPLSLTGQTQGFMKGNLVKSNPTGPQTSNKAAAGSRQVRAGRSVT